MVRTPCFLGSIPGLGTKIRQAMKPKKKKTQTNKKTQNLKWPINIDIIQLKFKNRYVDESKKKAGIKLSQAIELYTVPTAAYKCSPEFSARAASLHNFCGCQSQN